MALESIEKPSLGIGEVLIQIKAAGLNYNHLWACKGQPLPVSRLHPEEPRHIGGSDASGIVVEIGPGVRKARIGHEVIIHPNQSCGQCPACNGGEPLSCEDQKAWGFETSWGSFAEYARVQAQQLIPKPIHLSWEEAACYPLKFFTAYRMLVKQAQVRPGERVLIWGAAGGLGSYAIRLCQAVNAIPICIVSSEEKADYCRSLGAKLIVNRSEFPHLAESTTHDPTSDDLRRLRKTLRQLTGGVDPDVVFEHTGRNTFSSSVFLAAKLGRIVICGATSGYQLTFDARYLWMHQKRILGSHGCNAFDAARANQLIVQKTIQPTLTRVFKFEEAAAAHELLLENRHLGSWALQVGG